MPRKKIPADIRSLSRAYTDEGVRQLASVMRNAEKDSDRLHAIEILFERGHGRPPQPHVGEDGEGSIEITIRHILEGEKMKRIYSYELLCEILQDAETQRTGRVSNNILKIDTTDDEGVAIVVHFQDDPPSAADLRDDAQQELDYNAQNRNPQSKSGK